MCTANAGSSLVPSPLLSAKGAGHETMLGHLHAEVLVEPGDQVLVLRNGIWGTRAKDIAERCGMYLGMYTRPGLPKF